MLTNQLKEKEISTNKSLFAFADLKHSAWFFVYLTAILVTSYYGSYAGGLQYLIMPYDFILLFFISAVSLWMSRVSCLAGKDSEKFSDDLCIHERDEIIFSNIP